MTPYERVLAALESRGCRVLRNGAKAAGQCPYHDDRHESLSLTEADDGRALIRCHAGCGTDAVVAALGLQMSDLFLKNGNAREVVAQYDYTDEKGHQLYQVVRFQPKDFRQRRPDGNGGWTWSLGDVRRVLYRLPAVLDAVQAGQTVWVAEGEKDVHALESAGEVATCNPMGAGKWRQEYTDVLAGADVVVVADSDEAGLKHAREVVRQLIPLASSVRLVGPPKHKDVSQHLAANGKLSELEPLETPTRDESQLSDLTIEQVLAKAGVSEEQLEGIHSANDLLKLLGGVKKSVTDQVVQAVMDAGAQMFHDDAARCYATFDREGHTETWPVKSRAFRLFARHAYWLATLEEGDDPARRGKSANAQAITDAVSTLEGEALFNGEELDVHLRVAHVEGAIYIDLGDEAWRCVQVTRSGWTVLDRHPVRFRRAGGMAALPDPVRGGDLDLLRAFLNVADDDWHLVAAWLVASVRERFPCPVLVLHGEQGSGKSTAARILRSLIDPHTAPLRRAPNDIDDLMVSASHNHVVAFDNLSHLEPALSDAICRLSTGGGQAKRALYTDDDEHVLDAQRPVIINGIEELATRSDLLDRALVVELPVIVDRTRTDERAFWTSFERERPRIFGALLDVIVVALARIDAIDLDYMPRMADFAKWVVAAEPSLGWGSGDFLDSYMRNRSQSDELAIEASPVGDPLCVIAKRGFRGTTTELLDQLADLAGDKAKSRSWPKNPRALASAIKRLAPNLRKQGYTVGYEPAGSGRKKLIVLEQTNG